MPDLSRDWQRKRFAPRAHLPDARRAGRAPAVGRHSRAAYRYLSRLPRLRGRLSQRGALRRPSRSHPGSHREALSAFAVAEIAPPVCHRTDLPFPPADGTGSAPGQAHQAIQTGVAVAQVRAGCAGAYPRRSQPLAVAALLARRHGGKPRPSWFPQRVRHERALRRHQCRQRASPQPRRLRCAHATGAGLLRRPLCPRGKPRTSPRFGPAQHQDFRRRPT